MPKFTDRLSHAWNAFMNRDPTPYTYRHEEMVSYSYRPDHFRLTRGNERSVVTAIYNRLALDVASINIKHIREDSNGYFIETIESDLNNCLTVEANKDQTARAFIQDVCMSMFDEGVVAIVPVDTSVNPRITGSYDIHSLRTGKIVEWYPDMVKVNVYNDRKGKREDIICYKKNVAIIENPLYYIMNEPNSTLQRLIRKLNLLDVIDEQNGSGKLDLIIQLPYVIKTEARRSQAEQRRKEIEMQLAGSKYGIAYTDGTEKIQQLNRSIENNMMAQVEYLTSTLYSQLGLTPEILNGTANEQTMMNYYSRTIEPIVAAITDGMKVKFLTKTARSQKQTISFFRDPFNLVPTSNLAELADKFTRNEIMSSNEFRQVVGLLPVDDARANELRNKNINAADGQEFANTNMEGQQYMEPSYEEGAEEPEEVDVFSQRIDWRNQNGE